MKTKSPMIPAVLGGLFLALALLPGQDKLRESVTVTAVEIPVRVFDKTGFVGGLTREDFEIFEGGVRQDISGFEFVSRSILPLSTELPPGVTRVPRQRNFILVFNVYSFTQQIKDAVGYFFDKIYNPGDRLIIIVNEGLLKAKPDESGERLRSRLYAVLDTVQKESKRELDLTFRFLDKRAENLELALNGDPSSDYPMDFVDNNDNERDINNRRVDPFLPTNAFFQDYKRAWDEYRRRRLGVNLDLYKTIAKRFGKLEGDKWAICFQQRDLFPKLKASGRLEQTIQEKVDSELGTDPRATLIETQRHEIELSFDTSDNYPRERIRELFTQANITFHVLLMKAVGVQEGYLSQDIDVGEVRADYENTLREISRETGGTSAYSNNVLESLKAAAARMDQYYLIVYQPKKGIVEPGKKIEVRVRKKDVNVISLKERTTAKPEGIMIFDFMPGPRSIVFHLKDYARPPSEWNMKGRAIVKVAVFDESSAKVFSKETALDLKADNVRISLEMGSIVPGVHFVVIEAYDIISGEKAVFSQSVRFE
jgi:VWFA-related protein